MKRITSFQHSGERYASLRVIAFIFRLVGSALLGISGLLLAYGFYTLAVAAGGTPPQGADLFAGTRVNALPITYWLGATAWWLWSFATLLSGLQMLAAAILIELMIHMEENTRATAQLLDKIRSRMEPSPEDVEPMFRA